MVDLSFETRQKSCVILYIARFIGGIFNLLSWHQERFQSFLDGLSFQYILISMPPTLLAQRSRFFKSIIYLRELKHSYLAIFAV